AQLDNTIKNIRQALDPSFSSVVPSDPHGYIVAMNSHNDLIDWTLSDFQMMAEKLASRSGFFQKRKVSQWIQARLDGSKEFNDEVRSRLQELEQRRAQAAETEKNPKALLQIFTDPIMWGKAKWSGTVFIY